MANSIDPLSEYRIGRIRGKGNFIDTPTRPTNVTVGISPTPIYALNREAGYADAKTMISTSRHKNKTYYT